MAESQNRIVLLRLMEPAALVLMNWLGSGAVGKLPLGHPSERQALADLLTALEAAVADPTKEELVRAQYVLLRDAGTWLKDKRANNG
jgi:hypothetical protein